MYNVNIIGDITDATLQLIDQAISQPDREIMLHINSCGGSLQAGLMAYDKIRQCADKQFFANVEGDCMSSATLFLMAVPLANRTASPHSLFLLHNPLTGIGGYQSLNDIKSILNSMEDAKSKLVDIYSQRTSMTSEAVSMLMDEEKELYADRAVELGIIARTNDLYNNRLDKDNKKQMRNKSFLRSFINKTLKSLLNEIYQTVDGQELDIEKLEIGAATTAEDGVYELSTGEIITVTDGKIEDIVSAKAEEEAPVTEEPVEAVKNEGEPEETPAEPEATEEEVVETIKEEVTENLEEVETMDELKQIEELIKEAISAEINEVQAKYNELQSLVNQCGGADRLKAMLNAKHEAKVIEAAATKSGRKTLAEIMNAKNKYALTYSHP